VVREVAGPLSESLSLLGPHPYVLGFGVALDLAIGDPTYAWHPIRLVGTTLTWMETRLRAAGRDGYLGGVLLFLWLAAAAVGATGVVIALTASISSELAWLIHAFVVYSLLALGSLLRHVWKIEAALRAGNLTGARAAVGELVGRDTDRMDPASCRRAAVESLSENLTDGFVSPLFWYALGGIPGLVLFKVVSTMDSMVGYKTERYVRFGWCGARLDDAMNYVPARLTWLVIAVIAGALPGYSGSRAWLVGLRQHALLPSPNSGWSEAATAGGLRRRLVGPVWLHGNLITDLWIGDVRDPPLQEARDVNRAIVLTVSSGLAAAIVTVVALAAVR
jgi:adenosylcobinamide-phosphate synthase